MVLPMESRMNEIKECLSEALIASELIQLTVNVIKVVNILSIKVRNRLMIKRPTTSQK